MERERITISIKKNILKNIDKTIDGTNVRNRSHAIETLVNKALNVNDISEAVIMLGGKDALKMVPSAVENILALKTLGFKKIYIAAGFLADKIKQKIGSTNEYGLKIEFIEGEGSGGALSALNKRLKSSFLIIEPEFNFNEIGEMVDFHKAHNTIATIFTKNLETYSGLYIVEPEIFKYIPNGFSMLTEDIFPKLIKEGKLVVVPTI